jgi:hypothetical protein
MTVAIGIIVLECSTVVWCKYQPMWHAAGLRVSLLDDHLLPLYKLQVVQGLGKDVCLCLGFMRMAVLKRHLAQLGKR